MKTKGQAQLRLLPAIGGIFFLVFGRISYKFWGLLILLASSTFIVMYSNQISPTLRESLTRLDSISLPTITQTKSSPAAKKITEVDLLEAEGLVKTSQDTLPFSRKLTVFSTSYDKNCAGCSGTTATGMKTGYGVVAVDPKVIPLGSRLYIPGYGEAVAGDTGSSIKGNKIDLGFDDVKNGWWSSRFVEIYVLE
jgi:3D (Asp-Asp-Asp) domain-containing protein